MQIEIAGGVLTTEHDSASFSRPIFVLNGIAHQPDDAIENVASSSPLGPMKAGDLVAREYSSEVDRGRIFSTSEYNTIARFAGLPIANYCSGE